MYALFVACLIALLSGTALGARAQAPAQSGDVAPRRLGAPITRYPGPFSAIAGVRELPNGRLLVSDAREKRVVVLGADGEVVRSIGREGRGPGEFVTPGGLYPVRGDTTYLYDRAQDRFLVIDPELRAGDTREPRGGRTGTRVSDWDPYQVDSLGRVVRQERSVRRDPAGDEASGEWLVRYDPATARNDSITILRLPPRTVRRDGPITVSQEQPFGPRDAWALAADGRVALVRAEPYSVEWWRDGRIITRGPEVVHRPVRVMAEDRAAYQEARQRSSARIAIGGQGGRAPTVVTPRGPGLEFPEVKAPFGSRSARIDAGGRVWVERSRPHGATETIHDVFDGAGHLVERIALPAGHRIVGFGHGVVYVVEKDEDDLEWLRRVPLRD